MSTSLSREVSKHNPTGSDGDAARGANVSTSRRVTVGLSSATPSVALPQGGEQLRFGRVLEQKAGGTRTQSLENVLV